MYYREEHELESYKPYEFIDRNPMVLQACSMWCGFLLITDSSTQSLFRIPQKLFYYNIIIITMMEIYSKNIYTSKTKITSDGFN